MNKELNKLLMQLVDLHPKYIDLSLDRLNNLLEKLKNPHLKIPPVIHIAGTNGKGSVLSFLKEILIGNNQELLDLKFLFISGTPYREVLDVKNIFP